MSRDNRVLQRWKFRLVALLAMVFGTMKPASAGPVDWGNYARFVGATMQEALAQESNPAAQRFHDFLDRQAQKADNPAPDLVIRVWLNGKGRVARLEIPELGCPQASKDLFSALTAQPLNRRPPSNMPMPLILRLQLSY